MIRKVAVYCGSKAGSRPVYAEAARGLGAALASRQVGLVYGGAAHGLMGTVADAVLAAGQTAIGVIPQGLARQEFAHPQLTEVHFVESMHQRKALMIDLADAFIALPGGFGTMDELFEVLTWAQVGLHQKPIGLLNVDGFYDSLLEWVRVSLREGFVPSGLSNVLVAEKTPDALVDQLVKHQPPPPAVTWIRQS